MESCVVSEVDLAGRVVDRGGLEHVLVLYYDIARVGQRCNAGQVAIIEIQMATIGEGVIDGQVAFDIEDAVGQGGCSRWSIDRGRVTWSPTDEVTDALKPLKSSIALAMSL